MAKSYVNKQIPIDYIWIDAGWYGDKTSTNPFDGLWDKNVGNWNHNTTILPNGFKPISDLIHENGMKFLLWFEPERVVYGTPFSLEHPQWMLGQTGENKNMLFNLGIPEARQWLTTFINGKINEYGIDCYRQDYNIEPINYWINNDEQNRYGITEIRYVEGLYQYWDSLRLDNPNLLIDNCASGGRRIDIETLKRSIPLWRSDYQCTNFPDAISEGGQFQYSSLAYWVPLSGSGFPGGLPKDEYDFRSHMGPSMVLPKTFSDPVFLKKMVEQYKRARPLYYGDFYQLIEPNVFLSDWLSYELYRADMGKGMVMAFRRENCEEAEQTVCLSGLVSDWTYEIEDIDTGEKLISTGKQLMEKGLVMKTKDKNESKLYFFEKVKG
jgi:alpha-galactosidase